jgi:hypothetical protein
MVIGGLKRKKLLPVFLFFFLGYCGSSSSSSCCYCFHSNKFNKGGGCKLVAIVVVDVVKTR